MSEPMKTNVVDYWLEMEALTDSGSRVVTALKSATKSMKLDEGVVLRKLRDLYNEAPTTHLETDVTD